MSTAVDQSKCRWCGFTHGPQCPVVKSIEFYEDGVTVKRLEYKTANDYPPLTAGFAPNALGRLQSDGGRYLGLKQE